LSELEFTGERVVPGLVDADLFNEHLARYRFAARFSARFNGGGRVLDAGCGTGYGTAEFNAAERIVAMDISEAAVAHAKRAFGRPGVCFLTGDCASLPFAEGSFDLVAAFEVIEHLDRWRDLLTEARRILQPGGVLLVSTPNKAYYAETRAAAGPNPYHVREFEYREFEDALQEVFPHVRLWSQNHAEVIAFVSAVASAGVLDARPDTTPQQAHFFLAACSVSPVTETEAFGWLPASGNVLRERERHIVLLKSELAQKDAWLRQSQEDRGALQQKHEELIAELRRSNAWAEGLNAKLNAAGATIAELHAELHRSNAWAEGLNAELKTAGGTIGQLHHDLAVRLDWVHDIEAQLARARDEIQRLDRESLERTQWAQSLDAELQKVKSEREQLEAQLALARDSKWVRLGRTLGVGPVIET